MTKLLKLLVEISSISNYLLMEIGKYSLSKEEEIKILNRIEKIVGELRKVFVSVRS